jgi:hypothetical protein
VSGPAHVATSREALTHSEQSEMLSGRAEFSFSRPWWRVKRACLVATTVIRTDCGASPTCGASVSTTYSVIRSVSLWNFIILGYSLKHKNDDCQN